MRELTDEVKNKIKNEASKRLASSSQVVEDYALILEAQWEAGLISFGWENE